MLKEIILVTVLYVGFVFPSSGQTTTGFNCEGAEVYISTTASLFSTCSDLYVKGSNLWNEGQFYAEGLELIECEDAKLGSGTFSLHSDYSVDISGDFIQFGVFNLDLPDSKLSINSDCEISDRLFLKSGLVSIEGGHSIFISNTDEDAIIFNNSIDNDSYISGSLKRKIASNGTYYFPVGNESSFHPFCLSDALSEDEISVIFDENVPFNWESSNVNSTLKLEDVGGWIVSSDYAIENNFVPIVSKLDYSQNLLS
ncbi:hypothetical protein QUH73_20815, partial [Labilibaculum sp. K2S]|uniref:hypothetical protein n=1 Tax=Labilibaculum sp. K2S TaxID=3056386 RepID=UPI0025A416E9